MEEKKLFKVTSNPIVRTPRGTDKIMLDVIIALVPALGVGAYMFGMNVAILLCVNVVCCVFFEWAYRKLMKKNNTIGDLSAVVTAVLITCVMPSAAPWWLGINRLVLCHCRSQAALRRHRQELPQPGARGPCLSLCRLRRLHDCLGSAQHSA